MLGEALKMAFSVSLNEGDSEEQTYGCRQKNLNICGINQIEGVCIFASR